MLHSVRKKLLTSFYNFFNTHIEGVTTKTKASAQSYTLASEIYADDKDAVLLMDSKTFIWIYKIPANTLTSWFLPDGGIESIRDINESPVSGDEKKTELLQRIQILISQDIKKEIYSHILPPLTLITLKASMRRAYSDQKHST